MTCLTVSDFQERDTLPVLLIDFYKAAHRKMYPKGTGLVYATWTPRSSKYAKEYGTDHVVFLGVVPLISKWLIDEFNHCFFHRNQDEVVKEYEQFIAKTLGPDYIESDHIRELHKLQYLPIEIRAVPEGTSVKVRTPMMSIHNTNKKFFWLTNYLETLISCELWGTCTAATIAKQYKKLFVEMAEKTGGDIAFTDFQGHDFSMRGMLGVEAAKLTGLGHLASFKGTDTVPAIDAVYRNYKVQPTTLVGTSIPASEHSVQCAYGDDIEYFRNVITEAFPKGLVSIVSDGYDFWDVMTRVLTELKPDIMAREGKVVIRPDSGDPLNIICGTASDAVFDTLEQALEEVNGLHYDQSAEDCEGRNQVGNDQYETQVYIKQEGKYYLLTTPFEYNRHDKTYYYIDNYSKGMGETTAKEVQPTPEIKGALQLLWETFGGTINDKGYKVLDPHVGLIYGDSITYARAKSILETMDKLGFCSTNVVLGIGSYTYQFVTRDTFGFAMKTTMAWIDGFEKMIFKDPKTDDGTKKSQRGCVAVYEDGTWEDGLTSKQIGLFFPEEATKPSILQPIFSNGRLLFLPQWELVTERTAASK